MYSQWKQDAAILWEFRAALADGNFVLANAIGAIRENREAMERAEAREEMRAAAEEKGQ